MIDFGLASFSEMGMELGARLKALRLSQEMHQTELAMRSGVSKYVVQELETHGKCSLESLLRIAFTLRREGEIEGLFKVKIELIAQMEAAERPKRFRAPRKYSNKPPPAK